MGNESGGAAVTITRTADVNAYAAGDVIGAATGSTAAVEFSGMGNPGSRIMITSARFAINDTALISGETTYRLHLYSRTPPSALVIDIRKKWGSYAAAVTNGFNNASDTVHPTTAGYLDIATVTRNVLQAIV